MKLPWRWGWGEGAIFEICRSCQWFVSGFLLGFSGNSQLDSLLAVGILSKSMFYISLVLMFTINTFFFRLNLLL